MHQTDIPESTTLCNGNVHICAYFCYKVVHCGIWNWCIAGFVTSILPCCGISYKGPIEMNWHWVSAKHQEAEDPLQWHNNERVSVSNHQPHNCLLNRLFGRRSKKTSKFHVTGLCAGNSLGIGEFPTQMASNAENVSIWWHHHVTKFCIICASLDCSSHLEWCSLLFAFPEWKYKHHWKLNAICMILKIARNPPNIHHHHHRSHPRYFPYPCNVTNVTKWHHIRDVTCMLWHVNSLAT